MTAFSNIESWLVHRLQPVGITPMLLKTATSITFLARVHFIKPKSRKVSKLVEACCGHYGSVPSHVARMLSESGIVTLNCQGTGLNIFTLLESGALILVCSAHRLQLFGPATATEVTDFVLWAVQAVCA